MCPAKNSPRSFPASGRATMIKRRTLLAEGSNPRVSEVSELPDDGSIREDAGDVHPASGSPYSFDSTVPDVSQRLAVSPIDTGQPESQNESSCAPRHTGAPSWRSGWL